MNFSDPKYIAYLLGPNIVSALVSNYAGRTGGSEWYRDLNRSPLTPPGWVFGVVWPILYLLLGHVLFSLNPNNPGRWWLYLNLILNYSWVVAFNRDQDYEFSWLIIMMMLITLVVFYYTNTQPELNVFLVPYFLWLSFAAYLSWYIWKNN